MYSLKKSLFALVGLLVLVGALSSIPLVSRGQGQGQGQPPFAQRTYYLTQTEHNGSQARTACAAGYHMASLWEIFDTSNLKYNTELGFMQGDSGFGPPTVAPGLGDIFPPPLGWIRTGAIAGSSNAAGLANCDAWTNASHTVMGSTGFLDARFSDTDLTRISPWAASTAPCDLLRKVWCVQD
jgi:hypothetical protein